MKSETSNRKVEISMPEDTFIVAVILPLLAILGGGIAKLLDYHRQIKELKIQKKKTDIDDEKLDVEKYQIDASAASSLADVLNKVVNPLAERISVLEREATERQKELSILNETVYDLKRIIHEKDLDLVKIRADYDCQVLLTREQERKIFAQSERINLQNARIEELESSIKTLKENSKNGNGNC